VSDFEEKSFSSKSIGLKRDPNTTSSSIWSNGSPKIQKNPFFSLDSSQQIFTTITEDVSIKGDITYDKDLKIEGKFEGTLSSNGRLHIGPKGYVKADLCLKSAIIEGRVEGNIEVEDSLEILRTAYIKGNIHAPSLKVEEGAEIMGSLSIFKPLS
jgi:cytoskeletal protein CcmA (bactofilin family)